ncbi:UvrD-helicase domain-containing protein, partial [bacterium]|nr:UvrD-helicase domain-containing protein [bacterium]
MGGEKMEELLGKLNEGQYAAVTSEERFVRVVAGAGSGKTRVLATRVAYLIANNGVPAQRILAITFTNKAALTMRLRVEEYLELAS